MNTAAEQHPKRGLGAALFRENLRSGAIAALVMVPFGLAFFLSGLRVNEYGLEVVRTFFGAVPGVLVEGTERIAPFGFGIFVVEHFLISWSVTLPLLLALLALKGRLPGWLVGLAYGLAFYVVMNSLLLPSVFGDPTPWQIGFEVVYPSLIVHLMYGFSVWYTSRAFVTRHAQRSAKA